jgi:peptide/nickel transport system substrate-binding protein
VISRRALLAGAGSAALVALGARPAEARARTPYGGRLTLHVPWPVSAVDPHRLDDATAALFGDALFDTLYAREGDGQLVPCLAETDPQPDGAGLRVSLRSGLRFASGAPLDARAVASSLARARTRDAAAWLTDIPPPRVVKNDLLFAFRDARRLVRALASPLVAIVSPKFVAEAPDGTGPLRAEIAGGSLRLSRNPLAATGPSFLDGIDATHAADLVTSLRAFESGADDVGWLGSFLHEPRQGARSFDAGAVCWAILRTGREAGAADARGGAQALADGVPHASLASLVVGPPWEPGSAQWSGSPCELLVRDDSPWLLEVARAVANALSSPAHEVTVRPITAGDLAARRLSRAYALMLDVCRPAGPGPLGALLGLTTADDPTAAVDVARHPPRGDLPPRSATRTLRLGVVGEVRLQGGRAADVVLPPSPWGRGVDWGSAYRSRRS